MSEKMDIAAIVAERDRLAARDGLDGERYRSIVDHLSVCDGGRYRNDAIEGVMSALKGRDKIAADLARLRPLAEAARAYKAAADVNAPDDAEAYGRALTMLKAAALALLDDPANAAAPPK